MSELHVTGSYRVVVVLWYRVYGVVQFRRVIYGNSTSSYRVVRSVIQCHNGTESYRNIQYSTMSYRVIRSKTVWY